MDIIKSQTCLIFDREEKEVIQETCYILDHLYQAMTSNPYKSIFNNEADDFLLKDDIGNTLDILNFLLKTNLTIN